jgi:hypothetical protein
VIAQHEEQERRLRQQQARQHPAGARHQAGAAAAGRDLDAGAGVGGPTGQPPAAGTGPTGAAPALISGLKQCLLAHLFKEAREQSLAAAAAAVAAAAGRGLPRKPGSTGSLPILAAASRAGSVPQQQGLGNGRFGHSASLPIIGPGDGGLGPAPTAPARAAVPIPVPAAGPVCHHWRRPLDRFYYYFDAYLELLMWKVRVRVWVAESGRGGRTGPRWLGGANGWRLASDKGPQGAPKSQLSVIHTVTLPLTRPHFPKHLATPCSPPVAPQAQLLDDQRLLVHWCPQEMLAGPHRHPGWVFVRLQRWRRWRVMLPMPLPSQPLPRTAISLPHPLIAPSFCRSLFSQARPLLRPRPAGELPHGLQPSNHAGGAPLCGPLPRVCRLVGAPLPASPLLALDWLPACLPPSAACWRLLFFNAVCCLGCRLHA